MQTTKAIAFLFALSVGSTAIGAARSPRQPARKVGKAPGAPSRGRAMSRLGARSPEATQLLKQRVVAVLQQGSAAEALGVLRDPAFDPNGGPHEVSAQLTPLGMTVFRAASDASFVPVLKQLLAHPELDVNQPDSQGRRIVHELYNLGATPEIANLIFSHPKFDPNAADHGGETYAMSLMNRQGWQSVTPTREAEFLRFVTHRNVYEKLDLMAEAPDRFKTTLGQYAVKQGYAALFKALHGRARFEVNHRDAYGNNLLMDALAAATDDAPLTEIIDALLKDKTFAINTPANNGDTVVGRALSFQRLATLTQILQRRPDVDVNARYYYDKTTPVFTMAVRIVGGNANAPLALIRAFLAAPGLDLGQRDGEGRTAIDVAKATGRRDLIELLTPYYKE